VRISAEAIWDLPRLPWFTDHRAQRHSRRLIALLGEATDALQHTDHRLRRAELYVLLAACYLHDIGMQDIVVGDKGWDELDVTDYEAIRKRHPERGKEIIVTGALSPDRGALRVDLDDRPDYMQPIALVSQGHGSAFYEATLHEFDTKVWAPDDGRPVRGGLLTALLLMADELDVGSERASFPRGGHLSALSSLHHFLNHYVVLTTIGEGLTSKRRQVRMAFEFPPDSDDYRPDVRRYLVDKICSQARRTNPTVEVATDGELVWEERIAVAEQTDTMAVRRELEPSALHELRRQVRRSDLVGRDDLVRHVRAAIAACDPDSDPVRAISLTAPEDSDLDAICRWMAAETAAADGSYIEISFLPQIATELAAIADELWRFAGEGPSDAAQDTPSLDPLVGALKRAGTCPVIVFRALEAAEPETRAAIEALSRNFAAHVRRGLVVMSHDGSVELEADPPYVLAPLDREILARHLSKEFGYAPDAAMALAGDFVSASNGRAGPIVSLVAGLRRANQVDHGRF
jgi:hypothetical protein